MKTKSINYFAIPKNKHKAEHDHPVKEERTVIAGFSESLHPIFSRAIIFDQEINEATSTALRAEVLAKSAENSEAPIFIFLGSPGGGLYESLAIYDTFQLISNPIVAICSGKVMSGGILILLACDMRLSTSNNTFMIHHGHTMLNGNVVQLNEQLNEIMSLNDRMLDIIIKKTKISREQLKAWLVKDHYMNTTEAVTHGLIDYEITSLDQIAIEEFSSDPDLEVIKKKTTKKANKKKATKKKTTKKTTKKVSR